MAAGAKVVGLRGCPVPNNADPDPKVVDMLERYLAQARDGQVRGIVFGIIRNGGNFVTGWMGDADEVAMLAVASLLMHRVAKSLDAE